MAKRTTLVLDEESRRAAAELATHLQCSVSEAIRRAIVKYRASIMGLSDDRRKQRKESLEELFRLFEGHDAAGEVDRLKLEDEGF